MKRALARGRILPQSLSTDSRMGRLSLKAVALFPLMWVNCDDQGRITGDPDEIKYAVCPNIEHITRQEVPGLLKELQDQNVILCYNSSKAKAIQMLDWWEWEHKLQWAWPSQFSPPENWTDHLRYKASAKEVVTENWPPAGSQLPLPGLSAENPGERSAENPGENSGEDSGEELGREIRSELVLLPDTVDRLAEHEAIKDKLAKLGARKGLIVKSEVTTEVGRIDLLWEEPTGEAIAAFEIDVYSPKEKSLTKLRDFGCIHSFVILRSNPQPLQWENDILLIGLAKERERTKEKEPKRGKRKEERGISPERSGEPSPSLITDTSEISKEITHCFKHWWGHIEAKNIDKVIPREPSAKEAAQLRDLAKSLSAAGGVPLDYIEQAFKEASSHEKHYISYVRKILLAWLPEPVQ